MKLKFFHSILAITLIFFLQACGSNSSNSDTQVGTITEENFVSLAKFHYSKESRELLKTPDTDENNNKKFRSYPGANAGLSTLSAADNSLQISTVTPFNQYIESMTLSLANETVELEVKNKIYVIVSYYKSGTLIKRVEQTLEEFQSFDLNTEGAPS